MIPTLTESEEELVRQSLAPSRYTTTTADNNNNNNNNKDYDDADIISSSRALQVRDFITQKVTETTINENAIRSSLSLGNTGGKFTSKLTESLMEMGTSAPGITSIAPVLEKACCRRVCKLVADHLGRHSLEIINML